MTKGKFLIINTFYQENHIVRSILVDYKIKAKVIFYNNTDHRLQKKINLFQNKVYQTYKQKTPWMKPESLSKPQIYLQIKSNVYTKIICISFIKQSSMYYSSICIRQNKENRG